MLYAAGKRRQKARIQKTEQNKKQNKKQNNKQNQRAKRFGSPFRPLILGMVGIQNKRKCFRGAGQFRAARYEYEKAL